MINTYHYYNRNLHLIFNLKLKLKIVLSKVGLTDLSNYLSIIYHICEYLDISFITKFKRLPYEKYIFIVDVCTLYSKNKIKEYFCKFFLFSKVSLSYT